MEKRITLLGFKRPIKRTTTDLGSALDFHSSMFIEQAFKRVSESVVLLREASQSILDLSRFV